MSGLQAIVLMHADVVVDAAPGRPRYCAGERYSVPEDTAALLIASGDASLHEVPVQSVNGERVPDADVAAFAARLAALAPAPTPDPTPAPAPPAAAKE